MINYAGIFPSLKDRVRNGVYDLVGTGAPLSGVFGVGTGSRLAGRGSTYTNLTTGVKYWNEGSATVPYWTPESFLQSQLLSWFSDFRDGVGKAVADTAATATIAGSGIRVFGDGIAETDSGLVIAIAEDGPIGTLTVTDEVSHIAALGVGITTSVPFQPDSHGPLVVDALVAMSSALTLRRFFMGFVGTAADALISPVTGSTTTITLVQDDLAGLMFDVGLTNADGLFAPSNKSDAAATQTAASCDTSTDFPAAGTYARFRVQISAAGRMTCFMNKAQIFDLAAALDVDEEVAPVLLIGSTSTAVKLMLVKNFAAWGQR
jgi:hypothetical protein